MAELHFQIEDIRGKLIEMGAIVEGMVAKATEALLERSDLLVDEVIELDLAVDDMEVEIDEACHTALALSQPMAVDMRFLVAVMKITGDLERMGDSAVNIAESVRRLNTEPPLRPYVDLPRMSSLAQTMVRESLDAFVRRDPRAAKKVCEADDAVDDLYEKIFGGLVALMADPEAKAVPRAVHLLLVARNLERIADHATNIGEDIVYYVEGTDIRHRGSG